MLVRDVFDVLTDDDEKPAPLAAAAAAAAGMVSKQRAAFIENAWREAAALLADNFHNSIRSTRRAPPPGSGPRPPPPPSRPTVTPASRSTSTATRSPSARPSAQVPSNTPETYAARNASKALVQSGVATHLNNNGPVTAPQVLAAIRAAVATLVPASQLNLDLVMFFKPRKPVALNQSDGAEEHVVNYIAVLEDLLRAS